MNAEETKKKKNVGLSGNVMKLKFMQRSKEKELRESLMKDQDEETEAYQWELDLPSVKPSNVVYLETNPFNEEYFAGRRSYNGKNPEIEKLMAEKQNLRNVKLLKASKRKLQGNGIKQDISDVEMASMMAKGQYEGPSAGKKLKFSAESGSTSQNGKHGNEKSRGISNPLRTDSDKRQKKRKRREKNK